MVSIEESYERLESFFYDHLQGQYPLDETPTFSEWFDELSNTQVVTYLALGEELLNEES